MKDDELVSFCIFAYNQERFIRDAIQGALLQDYNNLEIIISDDCSTDKTYDIIQEEISQYKGHHKVRAIRNQKNLGIAKHVCKVLYEEAKGAYVVIAAGDDISLPARTKVSIEFLQMHPEVSSLSLFSGFIDEEGNPISNFRYDMISMGSYSIFTLADYIQFNLFVFSGDSRVLRRNVIDAFPPLEYSYAEDIYLFIRSLYLGSVAYLRYPLVLYRQHPNSVMGKSRTRKKVTREALDRFKRAQQQLYSDAEYALNKGYVNKEYRSVLYSKLRHVVEFLRPHAHSKVRSEIRKVCSFIKRKIDKYL